MPGPVVQLSDPWSWVPDWLKPQGASVTDPAWVPPVRFTFNKAADVVHALGLDDPQQQVLGLMGAMTAPGGEASPAAAALEKAAEKFPRLAKVIKAFHGSGGDFDRFSMDYIGSGEGAQAYGHGLYFAEHEPTAKYYRDTVSLGSATTNEQLADYFQPGKIVKGYGGYDRVLEYKPPTPEKNYQWGVKVESVKQTPTGEWVATEQPRWHSTAPTGREYAAATGKPLGKMYEVAIHADPEDFLDWDKPLSQQSEKVRAAVGELSLSVKDGTPLAGGGVLRIEKSEDFGPRYFLEMGGSKMRLSPSDVVNLVGTGEGKTAYQSLMNRVGSPEEATRTLREAGIPGIKYFDQLSRATSGGELIDVVQTPQGWQSKIRMERGGDSYITTSVPHPTRAAAEAWARDKISQGSRNYVVFDDALIEIRRKYGWVLPAAVGAQVEYLRRKANQQGGKIAQSDLDGI